VLTPEKSLCRVVWKVTVSALVAVALQMALEAPPPPVVPPEEKNSAVQGAGETSRKSDSSSDGFRQLGITTSVALPSAEVLAVFEAELRQQIPSAAADDRALVPSVATC
jgi:hypothetical protein